MISIIFLLLPSRFLSREPKSLGTCHPEIVFDRRLTQLQLSGGYKFNRLLKTVGQTLSGSSTQTMKALALTLMATASFIVRPCEGQPVPDNLGDLQAEGDLGNLGDLQAGWD